MPTMQTVQITLNVHAACQAMIALENRRASVARHMAEYGHMTLRDLDSIDKMDAALRQFERGGLSPLYEPGPVPRHRALVPCANGAGHAG